MSFEQMRELERIEQENKEKAEEDPDRELLDYYIEEGLKYVYPERYIQWIDFVKNNYKNFTVVQDVLNTMKSLARECLLKELKIYLTIQGKIVNLMSYV